MDDEFSKLDELMRAIEFYAVVYQDEPDAVPLPLRDACAAICATRDGVPTDHVEWHNDAIDLLAEAERDHDRSATDQAIFKLGVVALAARDHPLVSGYLSHLGTAWADRFRMTGRIGDLDNAIEAHRKALALPPVQPADRAGFRANYSAALLARYEATGQGGDLDQATELARQAVALAPDARAGQGDLSARFARSISLQNLAVALSRQFQRGRDQADLDEAIEAARHAIEVTDGPGREFAIVQALLANMLLERFVRNWDPGDLRDAMAAAEAGAEAAPPAGRVLGVALSALASAFLNRFKHTGEIRDIDRAIATGERSVAAAQGDPAAAAICLANLGGILAIRYERTGDAVSLDEAAETLRRAVLGAPGRDVNRPNFLSGLGNVLRRRFQLGGASADIDEAVQVLREAVATAPAGWLDRPGYVANLAEALIAKAEPEEDAAGLGEAAALLRDELGLIPPAHPLRHLCLASAGHAWLTVFDLTDDADSLDRAIGYWEQAAGAVPAGHPQHAEHLTTLGAAWQRKFDRSREAGRPDQAAGTAAVEASKAAASVGTASPLTRALAARNWGYTAAALGDTLEAVSGFAAAVELLDQVAWRGLRRGDQERQLGRFTGLAGAAGACAIEAGQPERAVELIEQGRGVLLAQALADRARKHELFEDAPELARELAAVDDLLESVPSAAGLIPATPEGAAVLSRRRSDILARIRALPGYSGFLRAPSFDDLRAAAKEGPVVIVNVSQYRCDALIVTAGGVRVVPLTRLTGTGSVDHTVAFLEALASLQRGQDMEAAGDTVTATLRWLWEVIVSPLLPGLLAACLPGGEQDGQRPRVWWCPTGPLMFFPLHAAGVHDGGGDSLLNHVVSSYALTLRLLRRARERTGRGAGSAPIVVALEEIPGQPPLPNAGREADAVVARLPGARQFRGATAEAGAVATALAGSPRVAHFACHGVQNITDPSSGHLALYDGPLGIPRIAGMRLEAAELAFLSACETSRGGGDLVDEGITMAAAFHLAGFRHVVGTLWSINDAIARAVAGHVYESLTHDGNTDLDTSGTAAAVDAAIRRRLTRPPWLWAAYIHLGP